MKKLESVQMECLIGASADGAKCFAVGIAAFYLKGLGVIFITSAAANAVYNLYLSERVSYCMNS